MATYGFGMGGTMPLVSVWMPNESIHRLLVMYDDNLGVVQRLHFVRLLHVSLLSRRLTSHDSYSILPMGYTVVGRYHSKR